MPDFYNKYPYTDFHEMNLDWILTKMKELIAEWAQTKTEWSQMQLDFQTLSADFTDLKNYVDSYFDNLDVQEEINNKLDEMALNGELQTILAPFLGYATPEMYGAAGDGITDDTDAIRECMLNNNTILFTKNYLVGYHPEDIYYDSLSNAYADFLTLRSNMTINITGSLQAIHNDLQGYRMFTGDDLENVIIKGGKIIGDKTSHTAAGSEYSHCFNIKGCKNLTISDVNITLFDGDGIYIGQGTSSPCEYIIIDNCVIENNGRNNISLVSGKNVIIHDCILKDPDKYNPKANIDCEPNNNTTDIVTATISNITCIGGNYSFEAALYNTSQNSDIIVNGLKSDRPINISILDGSHVLDITGYNYKPNGFWTETRNCMVVRCNATSRANISGVLNLDYAGAWRLIGVVGDMYNCHFDIKTAGSNSYAWDVNNDSGYTISNCLLKCEVNTPYEPAYAAGVAEDIIRKIEYNNPVSMYNNFIVSPNGGSFIIDGAYYISASGVNDITKVKKGLHLSFNNTTGSSVTLYGITMPAQSITELVSYADQSLSVVRQFTY